QELCRVYLLSTFVQTCGSPPTLTAECVHGLRKVPTPQPLPRSTYPSISHCCGARTARRPTAWSMLPCCVLAVMMHAGAPVNSAVGLQLVRAPGWAASRQAGANPLNSSGQVLRPMMVARCIGRRCHDTFAGRSIRAAQQPEPARRHAAGAERR